VVNSIVANWATPPVLVSESQIMQNTDKAVNMTAASDSRCDWLAQADGAVLLLRIGDNLFKKKNKKTTKQKTQFSDDFPSKKEKKKKKRTHHLLNILPLYNQVGISEIRDVLLSIRDEEAETEKKKKIYKKKKEQLRSSNNQQRDQAPNLA